MSFDISVNQQPDGAIAPEDFAAFEMEAAKIEGLVA